MKKILILGGTRFVGRNLVEKLIETEKYNITLFNRGNLNADLFPAVETIKGDRKVAEDLRRICAKDWDVVIDVSGYWAGALEQQINLQSGKIGKYIYISTSSHYEFDETNPHLIQENEDLVPCTLEQKFSDNPMYYNQNKAECERILQKQNALNYLILRPGLIIGKYDYTDRLYYWFYKLKHQAEMLICNNGENIISYTNVCDLVDLIMLSIETDRNFKVYNVTSFTASLKDFIDIGTELLNTNVELISATPEFLEENAVSQWTDLPLWLNGNFLTTDNSRAISDFGFTFRDIHKSVEQILNYYSEIKKWEYPKTTPVPIAAEKELALIKKIKTNVKI
ncbi:MAG: NAD-dependent epimerase/dehydratase family protein [Chitinophagales bacterium]|nr:NAD-dependent epimerase/dehydratase family protein [Bacteroidota bacterium]MCB9044274.1 NAD-dependent epimerase/dehydratase family protein [Chitinophagales bacterium]